MISTAELGRSGAAFTRLGLGTWAIGGPWRFGWGPVDDAESIAAIRRAVEEGINWVDTAAVYGLGHAEEIVGRALKGHATGDEVFVCTKCGRKTRPDGTPYGDLRPQSIRAECEASLRRLGVERIDLYQIHWPDPDSGTPLEESWSAMAELVDEGKVRWIGVSNFDVDQLERCEAIRHVDSRAAAAVDDPARSAARRDSVGRGARDRSDRLLADGLGAAERNLRSRSARASALRRHAPAAPRVRRALRCRRTSRSSSACARSPTSSAVRSPSSRLHGRSRRTE